MKNSFILFLVVFLFIIMFSNIREVQACYNGYCTNYSSGYNTYSNRYLPPNNYVNNYRGYNSSYYNSSLYNNGYNSAYYNNLPYSYKNNYGYNNNYGSNYRGYGYCNNFKC